MAALLLQERTWPGGVHSPRIGESSFFCQFRTLSEPDLARRMCGPASAAIVLSHYGLLDDRWRAGGSLAPFARFILDEHVDGDVEVLRRRYLSDGQELAVTVRRMAQSAEAPDDALAARPGDRVERGDRSRFNPAFTMAGGYDHRFSSALFQRFGADAELRHLDVAELGASFEREEVDFFLASVRSAFYEGGHVVVVDGYRNGVFTVVDPSDPVYRAAVRFYPTEAMSLVFNGFGTAVRR
ncbi:hypothetical protein LZ318_26240 [Saccharopolyspora indica]|uniref:hypothetical protein n=1 Tax=Saccharopolyspora indica TaxID=1229659 RepID=UPI0022EAB417|nr:hypothetical protein [Saccharopolyspora indica]MDA3648946.1 hypothetical protein [Saccharopolyspora indica]